jgi:hypothetical protein
MSILDDPALSRVIDAAGIPFCSDRDTFGNDLTACLSSYYLLCDRASPGKVNKGIERLSKLRRATLQLAELLEEDDTDHGHIHELWSAHGRNFPDLLPQLKLLSELLAKVSTSRLPRVAGSPLEILTGVLLPEVFRMYFRNRKGEVGTSRNTIDGAHVPSGPYVRFASQVLTEFEIPCRPETIVSAMKRMKRNGANPAE